MPWTESVTMQRLQFITDYNVGDTSFTELCLRYRISRKTGYKWINRYITDDISSLSDRSRARHTQNRISASLVQLILEQKNRYPNWGPEKIRHRLLIQNIKNVPAASTIGKHLKVQGLVQKRKIRRYRSSTSQSLHDITQPNDVWSADFKDKYLHTNKRWCCPSVYANG